MKSSNLKSPSALPTAKATKMHMAQEARIIWHKTFGVPPKQVTVKISC